MNLLQQLALLLLQFDLLLQQVHLLASLLSLCLKLVHCHRLCCQLQSQFVHQFFRRGLLCSRSFCRFGHCDNLLLVLPHLLGVGCL